MLLYQTVLGPLRAGKLWQTNILLGGLCYLARHYRCIHSISSATATEYVTITESTEGGIDSCFLSRIFVSIYSGIKTH
jgi:hypothetical protein